MKTSFFFGLLFVSVTLSAQWNGSTSVNNPICTVTDYQYASAITSDGAGGAIIAWSDGRAGNFDIYVQRIDANGFILWAADGVAVCNASGDQYFPVIISDGTGGAVITWTDYRNDVGFTNRDVFAQRINAAGIVQWTANGIPVCNNTSDQTSPRLVSFGSGGAIFTWGDNRNGSTNTDIYAQAVDGNGNFLWTVNGLPVCTATSYQLNPYLISDGATNATLVWIDNRSGNYDIYAQRVNASGVAQWMANGVAICTAGGAQGNAVIVDDASAGAIIAWDDFRGGSTSDLYAQRVDASGTAQWTTNGVVVSNASNYQTQPEAIADGSGGMILVWLDYRNGADFSIRDIYAQRISSFGVSQWTSNGLAVCTAPNHQLGYKLISDGLGGAIITWQDLRTGTGDIYAQYVRGGGTLSWTNDGVIVCNATDNQEFPVLINDNNSGAIIAWADNRAGVNDIYASHLFSNGTLPVDFISFRAEKTANGNLLTWEVANQINNALFEVEVSEDGGSIFQKAGTVYAVLNNVTQERYNFLHRTTSSAPVKYYRLKQVDIDGKYKFSKVISIRESPVKNDLLSVYPNPSASIIEVAVNETGGLLSITDFLGRVVRRVKITSTQTTINIESLPGGIYNCHYKAKNTLLVIRK